MKNLKLGIIGNGFVGKATNTGFKNNVESFIVDPKLNTSITDLAKFDPEIIFICVPTPMNDDGTQDSSIIEKVYFELLKKIPNSIKVVKSTVLPEILNKLSKYDENLIYNPEFLREKHAKEDFVNSKLIIFGGRKEISEKVSMAYKNHSNCKTVDHIFVDISSASLIKYSINTFLATKVIYFNELKNIFDSLDVNDSWQEFTKILSKDTRLGESHMDIPGHDGRNGFGGACFPKDSLALMKFSSDLGLDMSVLRAAIKKNNYIRSQYEELDERETDQNVSFDDKI